MRSHLTSGERTRRVASTPTRHCPCEARAARASRPNAACGGAMETMQASFPFRKRLAEQHWRCSASSRGYRSLRRPLAGLAIRGRQGRRRTGSYAPPSRPSTTRWVPCSHPGSHPWQSPLDTAKMAHLGATLGTLPVCWSAGGFDVRALPSHGRRKALPALDITSCPRHSCRQRRGCAITFRPLHDADGEWRPLSRDRGCKAHVC